MGFSRGEADFQKDVKNFADLFFKKARPKKAFLGTFREREPKKAQFFG